MIAAAVFLSVRLTGQFSSIRFQGDIQLMKVYEYSSENLKRLLLKASKNDISHLELAEWCYSWCQKYWNDDDVKECDGLRLAEEIDTQWELYLLNSYDGMELETVDLTNIQMPQEWLLYWLNKVKLKKSYDQINRLTHVYIQTGSQNPILKWRYEYNLDKLSKIYRGTTLSKSFTYYNNDFLKSISENGNLLEYTYKGEEYTSQVKYTVGTNPANLLDYVPDNLYRTVEVKRNGQLLTSFDYHENGLPKKISHLNGSSVGMEYIKGRLDRLDLKKKSDAEYDNFTFEYDANQNIKKITSRDGITSYDYDELNQLKSETLPDGSVISYDYDAAGNRKVKEKTIDSVTTTISYGYDGANQLTSVGSQAYDYDENGNLKSDGSKTFQFNEFNQLEEIKDLAGNSIAKYTYDEEGKRKSTTTSEGTVNYYYNGDKILYETDSSNWVLREYTYDDYGHPLTMTSNGQTYYYLFNHHGDVLALTDSNGNVEASYTYDAWGNILSQSGPMASENPYRYAGYRYDENTKLYYLMARYYNLPPVFPVKGFT